MRAEFPEKCEFLFKASRYKVLFGGRGAGKSHSMAKALLIQAAQQRLRILCARELMSSIQESVHELLKQQIALLDLGNRFVVQQNAIRCDNGSELLFAGLRHNVARLKSTEGIDRVWVEEAESVSEESWATLIPTIRKAASEIWVTMNPDLTSDPAYQRFVVHPPPGAAIVKIGWQDNPWFEDTPLVAEKDWLYSVDPEAAAHVWGGETRQYGEAQILRGRWRVETFEPQADWDGPYFGCDWGYASDPTALVKLWIRRDPPDDARPEAPRRATLYVEHEAWGVGVDLDDTPSLFDRVPGARKHPIRADSARPETIAHMQRHGYPEIVAATKGPGSVEDGIEHLRGYRAIVIHPRCTHFAEEARLYSWKVDRLTGQVLPIPVDKHNHLIDSARYGLELVSSASDYGGSMVGFDAGAGATVSPWRM